MWWLRLFGAGVLQEALPFALSACAGGGGGNVVTPFVPALAPTPVSTTLPGISVSVSGVVNTTNNTVTGLTAPATDASTTVTTVGTIGRQGATGDVSSATATTSNASGGNVTVNSNIVNSANFFGGYANFNNNGPANPGIAASTATLGIGGALPSTLGITPQSYTYVAFGNWLQCTANCTGTTPTLNAGYFVYGSETPAGSIPNSGTATYLGSTQGTYTNSSGAKFAAESALTVVADFQNHSLNFTTSSSYTSPNSSTAPTADPSLNMTGTLTYPTGTTFSGSITDGGDAMERLPGASMAQQPTKWAACMV